ncbi:putative RNA polymerase ECF subfamily sigma factor [Oscillibacter valericigenes Sjm18-20]|nr:putative RNA polymerase ECF subfamily sigma factor [Oscillibacter valericigenes Sjm18-20]
MLPVYFAVLDEDDDRELFTVAYQQYYNNMMRVARRILPSQTQAEDAVHDAFLKIIQHFDDLKAIPEERRIYWVVAVTKNAALDLLRKERRDLPVDEEMENRLPAMPAEDGGFRALVEVIRRMPETYRRVLELRFLTEWSHAEIARELHITEGAVKTRVARGRQLLIEAMRKEGYVCG